MRLYGFTDATLSNGVDLSRMDLREDIGYSNATVNFTIPDGVDLDTIRYLSIWCVPVGASFGDGPLLAAGGMPDSAAQATLLVNAFATLDSNNDGGLSLAEASLAFTLFSEAAFNEIDENGDGQLTEQELSRAASSSTSVGCFGQSKSNLRRSLSDLFLLGLAFLTLGGTYPLSANRN